jgi:hypothetical protein
MGRIERVKKRLNHIANKWNELERKAKKNQVSTKNNDYGKGWLY